ncbi:MAG TPA: hypothetical protein VNJ70_11950 [Thermoanaerobaculia bacterium]|nr:hypothetical protein [Thermoanaerobaculia bacterium]
MGIVHGAAGSGALVALAAARMPSTSAAAAYMSLFAIGSVLGMALVVAACGATVGRFFRDHGPWVVAASGCISVACGLVWGWSPLVALL